MKFWFQTQINENQIWFQKSNENLIMKSVYFNITYYYQIIWSPEKYFINHDFWQTILYYCEIFEFWRALKNFRPNPDQWWRPHGGFLEGVYEIVVGDAPKPPGGALYWRKPRGPSQNFEMTPNIDIVGSLKLIAYAPLEYGYKVSKLWNWTRHKNWVWGVLGDHFHLPKWVFLKKS